MEDINWWNVIRDNFLGFVIGTVILGSAFEGIRRFYEYILTKKYRGWQLEVIPEAKGRKAYTHELLWDEVRRFEQSPFENRKFIQSVCTSEGMRIKAGEIDTNDSSGWIYRDSNEKTYRFDFSKMPANVRA